MLFVLTMVEDLSTVFAKLVIQETVQAVVVSILTLFPLKFSFFLQVIKLLQKFCHRFLIIILNRFRYWQGKTDCKFS